MIDSCPLELMNVDVLPLLAQVRPRFVNHSRRSFPRLLHSLFPQSLCCALVSEPIMSGSLLSFAYLMSGVVCDGGMLSLISMYVEAKMTSLLSCLILIAIWSGVVNWSSSQHLLSMLLCTKIAALGFSSPLLQ